ncbi:2-oxoglutarate dehydrogenase complex dihydrolipoyllysine-residue succinyltransferase [bacterium]|jgi:2-oxoglutarate dehydrogenase E2 component (dihydrolipoamide succinyltransferase)|nr:2-oxoglutarate dehydrogenase complex dihydrolipoyllysine-residue succinyltransferase [bacterium]
MPIEIKAPTFAESISEAQIGEWVKKEGDFVDRDEVVLELETDKAALEVVAPVAGTIVKLLKKVGEKVTSGEIVAQIEPGPAPAGGAKKSATSAPAPSPVASKSPAPSAVPPVEAKIMPAARRVLAEKGIDPSQVSPSGPGGRILKEDAQSSSPAAGRQRELVPMTLIRKKIAARLVQAQQSAALLTTFNEVDMSTVMEMRKNYQEQFKETHGIKIGFMSFFVKAAVDALRRFPAVNAQVDGDAIAYHNYYDIGVAVGGGKGLVVPVIRSAERLGFAEIEKTIADFGGRAQENKIRPEELEGGTFTISNGGIYGSMLSTPIVNPPQSAILGLHAIQDRAVVRDGAIVVRPMMNLALTYDHRIIDGREAVSFLRRIKDAIENPARMLIEV